MLYPVHPKELTRRPRRISCPIRRCRRGAAAAALCGQQGGRRAWGERPPPPGPPLYTIGCMVVCRGCSAGAHRREVLGAPQPLGQGGGAGPHLRQRRGEGARRTGALNRRLPTASLPSPSSSCSPHSPGSQAPRARSTWRPQLQMAAGRGQPRLRRRRAARPHAAAQWFCRCPHSKDCMHSPAAAQPLQARAQHPGAPAHIPGRGGGRRRRRG